MEKTLVLGKIEGRKRRGRQKMRWLNGINSMDMNSSKEIVKDREDSKGQGRLACFSPWGRKESDMIE